MGTYLGEKRPENGLVVWAGELFFFQSFFTRFIEFLPRQPI
jgi:hypothetical protein